MMLCQSCGFFEYYGTPKETRCPNCEGEMIPYFSRKSACINDCKKVTSPTRIARKGEAIGRNGFEPTRKTNIRAKSSL